MLFTLPLLFVFSCTSFDALSRLFLLIPKILMWQHVQLSSFGARSGSLDLKYQNFAQQILNILIFAPKDPKDLEFCP